MTAHFPLPEKGVTLLKRDPKDVGLPAAGRMRIFVDAAGRLSAKDAAGKVTTPEVLIDELAALVTSNAVAGATDADLAAAVATLTSAINAKQDAASAATDSEVAAVVSTLNAAVALKQDASTAATDAELASEKGAREAADATLTSSAAAAKATADAALPKAGGTLTGDLTLKGDPTQNLHPVTRQFLEARIAALINGAPGALDTLKEIADQLSSDESAVAALTAAVTGKLAAASNLSDLVSAATARANLGLGSAALKATGDFDAAGAAAAEEARAKTAESSKLAKSEVGSAGEAGKALKADDATTADARTPKAHTHPSSEITGLGAAASAAIGSQGEEGKVLDASKAMYLWPTDSRIASPISLTGASYSDQGFNELVALATAQRMTIALPAGSEIKLKPGIYVKGGVQFVVAGSGKCAVLNFPDDQGMPANALVNGAVAKNATTLPLKFVTGGAFNAASPGSPRKAFVNRLGMIEYTGIEGTGETVTLTGVTGITAALDSSNRTVSQGCAIYADSPNETTRCTVFEAGIRIKGPSVGSAAAWFTETPPESMDGVWLGSNVRINCEVSGFRHCVAFTADHGIIGRDFRPNNCYSAVAWMGPRMTAGDHVVEAGAILTSAWWTSVYIADGNYMNNVAFGKCHLGGEAGWGVWKEANRGLGASEQSSGFISTGALLMHDPSFEGCRIGGIGCPDGKATLQTAVLSTPTFAWGQAPLNGLERKAPLACKCVKLTIHEGGGGFFSSYNASQQAIIISDEIVESKVTNLRAAILLAIEKGIPLVKGKIGENPEVDIAFREGRVVGQSTVDGEIKAGHVCAYRKPGSGTRGPRSNVSRYEAVTGVAGLAIGDAVAKVVALATNAEYQATVKVREQSNPPTSPAAAANATAGTLEARTYYYKVAAVLSGGGLMAASAEVSATPEANKSVKVTWVAPAVIPGGQTITGYRVFRGTAAGEEKGYKAVGAVLEYIDSGASLTGTSTPPAKNTGCEIYGKGLVRPYGAAAPGCACMASGPADNTAPVFAQTYEEPDNGETATIIITPALV